MAERTGAEPAWVLEPMTQPEMFQRAFPDGSPAATSTQTPAFTRVPTSSAADPAELRPDCDRGELPPVRDLRVWCPHSCRACREPAIHCPGLRRRCESHRLRMCRRRLGTAWHPMPAILSGVAIVCWLVLARRTVFDRLNGVRRGASLTKSAEASFPPLGSRWCDRCRRQVLRRVLAAQLGSHDEQQDANTKRDRSDQDGGVRSSRASKFPGDDRRLSCRVGFDRWRC